MPDKSVLLVIGGGIAAYKSLELVRELSRRGISSRCILTRAGQEFVTPLSIATLTGEKCYTEIFDSDDEVTMGHIQLSRSADLIVVCPATADLLSKAAMGLANDLASTAFLASDKPILFVPAMNVRMWENPATQRNVEQLKRDGKFVLHPEKGEMACGEFGFGRLPEVTKICNEIERFFETKAASDLTGKHAIVTAGPTIEPLDPVRFISNRSSGRQGYAIASALSNLGAKVTLISGPVELPVPLGVECHKVETAIQMSEAVHNSLPAEIFVGVAAVADWRPANCADTKVKVKGKSQLDFSITFIENPDILQSVAKLTANRPDLVIGFAAETNDVVEHAREKLLKKGCDWIVANDVAGDAMGGLENEITIVSKDGTKSWPRLNKNEVAARIARQVTDHFKSRTDAK